MMKKNTSFLFLVFFIFSATTFCQNSDSIDLKEYIDNIETEIKKVHQNFIIQNEKTEKISEEINANYKNQIDELKKLHVLLEKNSTEFNSINQRLSELESTTSINTKRIKHVEIRNYIFQFILLGLLMFLIIYVIRFRKQSLDYLLLKANNLSNQNDTIIEKAEELNSIKIALNELITEQRKKETEEKKSKRKKKKKK